MPLIGFTKVYTRMRDKVETGLVDGRQIWKNNWQRPAFAAEVATKAE